MALASRVVGFLISQPDLITSKDSANDRTGHSRHRTFGCDA